MDILDKSLCWLRGSWALRNQRRKPQKPNTKTNMLTKAAWMESPPVRTQRMRTALDTHGHKNESHAGDNKRV